MMWRNRWRVHAAASVALVVAALAGCSSGSGSGGGSGTAFVSGDGALTQVPPARRGAPVELSGSTLDNARLDLATLRGKPVVLNVWGSWCTPCRKEAPVLQAVYTDLRSEGVTFVGINTRDSVAAAQAFERRFEIGYPSIVDTGGLLLNLRGAVGPNAIPTTLVLDAQGRIAARFSGPITAATLRALVQDVATGK